MSTMPITTPVANSPSFLNMLASSVKDVERVDTIRKEECDNKYDHCHYHHNQYSLEHVSLL